MGNLKNAISYTSAIIKGHIWTVAVFNLADDAHMKNGNLAGYCDADIRRITLINPYENPFINEYIQDGTDKELASNFLYETFKHEVVHAVLYECGLRANSFTFNGAWPNNEEMVDWISSEADDMWKIFSDFYEKDLISLIDECEKNYKKNHPEGTTKAN